MIRLKYFISIAILFCLSLDTYAQNDIVNFKVNTLSSLFGKYEISFEKSLKESLTIDVEFAIHSKEAKDFKNMTLGTTEIRSDFNAPMWLDVLEERKIITVNHGRQGFSFQVGPRFYLYNLDKYRGLYIKPEFTFTQFDFSEYEVNHYHEESNFIESTEFNKRTMRNIGLAGNVGYQMLFYDRLLIDAFGFVGFQSRSIKSDTQTIYHGEAVMYYSDRNESTRDDWFPDLGIFLYGPLTAGASIKLGWSF